MPKLSVYVDDDLLKRVQKYRLPISPICQRALWTAIDVVETAACQECGQPAVFHVQSDDGGVYACRKHLVLYVTGISTVRAL